VVSYFAGLPNLFPGDFLRSPEFHFRTDCVISYESVDVLVCVDTDLAALTGIVLKVATGTRDHSLLQIGFRVIFAVFSLLFLTLRLKSTPLRFWLFEQQLTVVLLALNCLSDNLFFPLLIVPPTPFRFAAGLLFDQLLCAYFWFYVVIVFEFAAWRIGKWQPFSVIAPGLLIAGLRNWLPDRFFGHIALPELGGSDGRRWSEAMPRALFYLLVVAEILKKYRRPINPHDQYRLKKYHSSMSPPSHSSQSSSTRYSGSGYSATTRCTSCCRSCCSWHIFTVPTKSYGNSQRRHMTRNPR
jgi:hypothetical protein